jgi:heptosyltransferase-2
MVSVAARAGVAPLFEMVPGIATVVTLAHAGVPRTLGAVRVNRARLASAGFDAALLLPNSFHAAWLVARARIAERWGYARDWRARLLTRAVRPPPADLHQAAYYQHLTQALGVASGPLTARVFPTDDHRARAGVLTCEAGLSPVQPFVVFAPGAAYGRAKQWLPERWAELADLLVTTRRTAVVMVGATGDVNACREVAALTARRGGARVIDLAGRTDLPTLAALLSLSSAVVANDSGAMHLAAAVGARVVAVFGPTDDRKTSPLSAGSDHPAPQIVTHQVWCRPCMLRECPIDHRCMRGVSARDVLDALLLDSGVVTPS